MPEFLEPSRTLFFGISAAAVHFLSMTNPEPQDLGRRWEEVVGFPRRRPRFWLL